MATDTELAAMQLQLTQVNEKLDILIRSINKLANIEGQPLGAQQAATYLHISVSRLYSLVSETKIKPTQRKKGGRILFTKAQLDQYLNANDNLKN